MISTGHAPSSRVSGIFLVPTAKTSDLGGFAVRPPGSNLSLRHSGVFPASNRVGGVKRCWGVWVGVGGLIRRFGTVHMRFGTDAEGDGCGF